MTTLEILLLAIVQGIGEFLPISSSGHVVVLGEVFRQFGEPLEEMLTLNIVLHVGTLLAILVVYWRRVLGLVTADRRVIGLLVVGTLPAAVVGLALKTQCDNALESPLLAGTMFPITGVMLVWVGRKGSGELACRDLGYGGALVIGLFQSFALLPGISRSGATIVAGLACGLRREEAATFSFLLAIPAIGGAGVLEAVHLAGEPPSGEPMGLLALGAAVSFVVGLGALLWLLRWLQQGRLHHFAWWVLLLGPAVIAWQLLAR